MRSAVRGLAAVTAVVLAIVAGYLVHLGKDDEPPVGLTTEFVMREAVPCCNYDPQTRTVDTELSIDGRTADGDKVTVTIVVTAYADENTEFPVGSSSVSVEVTGTVHLPVHVVFPVRKPPRLDDDQNVIATREVTYRHSKR